MEKYIYLKNIDSGEKKYIYIYNGRNLDSDKKKQCKKYIVKNI